MEKVRKDFPQWMVDRKYIEQDGVCAKCGNPLTNGFHRHHKDGNPANNSYENLALLCIECHFATFKKEENPLERHRELERQVMDTIQQALAMTLEGRMTGSTLERVLEGCDRLLAESWKEKGIASQIEFPSPTFTMLRNMMKSGLVQEAFLEGFKEGVRAVSRKEV